MKPFDPQDVIFTALHRIGEVEPGPGGAMADYSISASWNGVTKEMAFKVLHDVMNIHEPDPFMYETADAIARKALIDMLKREAASMERDEMMREHFSGRYFHDRVALEDITFSEIQEKNDRIFMTGTFLGKTLAVHCYKPSADQAMKEGFGEKLAEEMKFSLLHAFRSSYERLAKDLKL